ncbi:MAG: thioredoxin-like domain-containing protein [Planctomycetales bacterium]
MPERFRRSDKLSALWIVLPQHIVIAGLALFGLCVANPLAAQDDDPPAAASDQEDEAASDDPGAIAAANPFPKRFKAPDLDGGTGWLNTAGEITLKDLRGKVVLLDFWTYCCINCMHVLPDLKYLEQKFDKQLVVIGVHSAKFENEKESDNIRRAIMRYEIEHPVINDSEMTVWRKFDVRSWPTLVLIDPEGYYCGHISGEGNRDTLEQAIDRVIAFHRRKKTLDESPVKFDLERNRSEASPLRFPGKVLADKAGDRLFISDSNHNRIVVATLQGKLREVIGTGAIGREDGGYDEASFDHPQGMALVGETLFVADTENHMIRAVDLAARQVKTISGTGKQGHERREGGPALKQSLNSPWDLVHVGGKLYIAMAGPHQLWMLDLKKNTIGPFAGSGLEDVTNGPLDRAALAQPSGITSDGKFLYVVDSEGSALRKVPLDGTENVSTLVGTSDLAQGRALFEFGDRDGVGSDARLQHPLGVVYHAGTLYVADSYNHKIKKVDPKKRSAKTWLGDGEPGDRSDPPRFSEPAGLSVAGDTLYVADTNNHRIRTVNLETDAVSVLEIEGLTPPTPPKPAATPDPEGKKPVRLAKQRIATGKSLEIEVTLKLPEGYKLNRLAPFTYRLKSLGDESLIPEEQLNARHEVEVSEEAETVTLTIPLLPGAAKGEFQITLSYGYCREGTGGLCKLGTQAWLIPLELAEDAQENRIRLTTK